MGVEVLNLGSRVLDPTDFYPLPPHLISAAPRPPSPLSDLHVSPLLLSPKPQSRDFPLPPVFTNYHQGKSIDWFVVEAILITAEWMLWFFPCWGQYSPAM